MDTKISYLVTQSQHYICIRIPSCIYKLCMALTEFKSFKLSLRLEVVEIVSQSQCNVCLLVPSLVYRLCISFKVLLPDGRTGGWVDGRTVR